MKKFFSFAATALAVLTLAACNSKSADTTPASSSASTSSEKTTQVIKVAAHTEPMTTMLELISPELEDAGYDLELVAVSDNVQANVALANKEVDANFFQHKLFMEEYNKGNQANLTRIQPIYSAIVGFYSKSYEELDQLPDGASVAIPSDPTNMTRALRLLAAGDLITLKDEKSYAITPDDIKDNPKNLTFEEVSLLNLNEAYEEKDLIFNYPTYIAKIGLNPTEHALLVEPELDNNYAVSLVAREDNQDDEKIKALQKALTSDTIREFIQDKLKGHAEVAFD